MGDVSGGAEVRVPLTHNKATLMSVAAEGTSACSDTAAATTMRWPCSQWKYTALWLALERAQEQLFPGGLGSSDGRTKVVIVLTDGVPNRAKRGPNYLRPTFLTLDKATQLKGAAGRSSWASPRAARGRVRASVRS